jgi:hypothetical protein
MRAGADLSASSSLARNLRSLDAPKEPRRWGGAAWGTRERERESERERQGGRRLDSLQFARSSLRPQRPY